MCALPMAWVGACRRTAGCVLAARHRGACRVGAMEEEEYEVERIVSSRKKRKGSGETTEYLARPPPKLQVTSY